jgi:glycosyltransferase 2 family protein
MKLPYKRWLIWLGLLISAFFLYIAFREIDFGELWVTLTQVRFWWLVPGLAIYFGAVLLRSWRWRYLLEPIKPVALRTIFPIVAIGYMGNDVFPFRMGEILRAVVLKRREGISISASLGTIVVERIFDAVVVVGFVLLNLGQLLGLSSASVTQLGGVAAWVAGIFLVGLVLFILVAMYPQPAHRLIHGIIQRVLPERFRAPVAKIADQFLEGLMQLSSPKHTLVVFLGTFIIWILETGLYWCVNQALGLGLNFSQLMLLNGVVNLVLLIPAAPGGLGTFDAAGRTMLEAFGIASEPALGFTLVLRVALWLPITLLGAVFFIREGLKWTLDIQEIEAQAGGDQPVGMKGKGDER